MTGSPRQDREGRNGRLRFIRNFRPVAGRYWNSEDRVLARRLFALVAGIDVALVPIAIQIDSVNGALYNALQMRVPKTFYHSPATLLSQWIGKPLIELNNVQQHLKADFRFAPVRVREEAEGIALYRGEDEARGNAKSCFSAVRDNFRRLIAANIRYYSFQSVVGQTPAFVPLLIAGPRYFSGALQLGPLMRSANAFGRVASGLSWLIDNYASFAEWRAAAERLAEFAAEMESYVHAASGNLVIQERDDGNELRPWAGAIKLNRKYWPFFMTANDAELQSQEKAQ
jgi:ABC-type uncharacterized transport system fused permease/ATPase subunit